MKHLRYRGEFVSIDGAIWRVDLLQEAEQAYDVIGSLTFDADEPLVIEWDNKAKEEVLCGSSATICIISPGDRTYEDLYSVEVGRVRMDVYRNQSLYWSGCIDTEFYEEPYEAFSGYTVSISFTDLGVLNRLKYDIVGMQSIRDILDYCLERSGINYGGLNESLISTQFSADQSALSLSDILVRSDNFYDEDGEATTLADALEGVLQPLGLKIVQLLGRIFVYDLNGLYRKGVRTQIQWTGDSQSMKADKVYNNVKITWSPYQHCEDLLPLECWLSDIDTPEELTSLDNLNPARHGSAMYFSAHHDISMSHNILDSDDVGFTTWLAEEGKGAELIADSDFIETSAGRFPGQVNFFKLVPQLSGEECEGVAIMTSTYALTWYQHAYGVGCNMVGAKFGCSINDLFSDKVKTPVLYKSSEVWLPPVDNDQSLLVRVAQKMLMDTRINPFTEANNITEITNLKDRYEHWQKYASIVYVPVLIKFQPEGSEDIYVWDDHNKMSGVTHAYLTSTLGSWVKYQEPSQGQPHTYRGHLAYYDKDYKEESCGVLGWRANRSIIGADTGCLFSNLTEAEDGQYLPYPNQGGRGGKLWIEVLGYDWSIHFREDNENNSKMLEWLNWILMQLPELTVVRRRLNGLPIEDEDIEYSAEIDKAAKEEINIDTICGTSNPTKPLARGAYFNKDRQIITSFTRASRTTQVEELLIGTIYSQYAKRKTVLSGEAQPLYAPIRAYTEANQGDKVFMLSGCFQDVRMNSSDATFVELRPDEYNKDNE